MLYHKLVLIVYLVGVLISGYFEKANAKESVKIQENNDWRLREINALTSGKGNKVSEGKLIFLTRR